MINWRLSSIALALIAVLAFLQYRLWFESGGMLDYFRLKKVLAAQALENEKLKKRNEEIAFQVERLRNSHDATESRARNELGMVKKGETFYQIVKKQE
jgi:cell division protein FtsB